MLYCSNWNAKSCLRASYHSDVQGVVNGSVGLLASAFVCYTDVLHMRFTFFEAEKKH